MTNMIWSKDQQFVRILDVRYCDRNLQNVEILVK